MIAKQYVGNETAHRVPPADLAQRPRSEDPSRYLADPKLAAAVNVALMLGKPLLLTGEPGTGKTRLAEHVAMALGLGSPERFDTRSTSQANDLFYRFDSLARFDAAHSAKRPHRALDFVTLGPLGKAILRTLPRDDQIFELLKLKYPEPSQKERSVTYPGYSVVLIDEIDKASRDFPNDMLDSIDNLRFSIRELEPETTGLLVQANSSADIQADKALRPVVIITSNSEKNLPDAFLRRVVYFHIPPHDEDQLRAIVARRMAAHGADADGAEGVSLSLLTTGALAAARTLDEKQCRPLLMTAVQWFIKLRGQDLRKKPSTAELIEWVGYLLASGMSPEQAVTDKPELLRTSMSVLTKCREDQELALTLIA